MFGVHPKGTPVPDANALPVEHAIPQQQQQQQQQQPQRQWIGVGTEEDSGRLQDGHRKIMRPA